jgi:toxin ParE1/3/4
MASSKLRVHNAALRDLEDALAWYSKISPELAEDLANKFIEALERISFNPLLHIELNWGYRKLNLERFPYKVVYKIFPDEILVVAVAHHKRLSGYWRKR